MSRRREAKSSMREPEPASTQAAEWHVVVRIGLSNGTVIESPPQPRAVADEFLLLFNPDANGDAGLYSAFSDVPWLPEAFDPHEVAAVEVRLAEADTRRAQKPEA
jgi:hypothetical protein